jgi:hypothetical protein
MIPNSLTTVALGPLVLSLSKDERPCSAHLQLALSPAEGQARQLHFR